MTRGVGNSPDTFIGEITHKVEHPTQDQESHAQPSNALPNLKNVTMVKELDVAQDRIRISHNGADDFISTIKEGEYVVTVLATNGSASFHTSCRDIKLHNEHVTYIIKVRGELFGYGGSAPNVFFGEIIKMEDSHQGQQGEDLDALQLLVNDSNAATHQVTVPSLSAASHSSSTTAPAGTQNSTSNPQDEKSDDEDEENNQKPAGSLATSLNDSQLFKSFCEADDVEVEVDHLVNLINCDVKQGMQFRLKSIEEKFSYTILKKGSVEEIQKIAGAVPAGSYLIINIRSNGSRKIFEIKHNRSTQKFIVTIDTHNSNACSIDKDCRP